jgi:uncharacterized protein (TIGR02147 family)
MNTVTRQIYSKTMRPVVYDYQAPVLFLNDLFEFNKSTKKFYSIRQASKKVQGCSPSLVTQILAGKRKFTRNHLTAFKIIFELNKFELDYIDKILSLDTQIKTEKFQSVKKETKNHILSDWVNLYVKDTVHLKEFAPDPKIVFKLLGGLIEIERISKAMKFLFAEGFWKKSIDHKVVADEAALHSTNNIPDASIRKFHKQALKIARDGVDQFDLDRRFSSTILLSVNEKSYQELRIIMNKFQNEIADFIDQNTDDNEQLVQVNLNLTPIGGKYEKNNLH